MMKLPLFSTLRLLVEVRRLRRATERIADAQERQLRLLERQYPMPAMPPAVGEAVEVSFVDSLEQQRMMEAELGLTAALGRAPTEEEILLEYDRRRVDG